MTRLLIGLCITLAFVACSEDSKDSLDGHTLPDLVSQFKTGVSCEGFKTLAYYDISNTFNRPLIANKHAFLDSLNSKLSFDEHLSYSSFYWYSDCCNHFNYQLIDHYDINLKESSFDKNDTLQKLLSEYLEIELLSDNAEQNIYGVLHVRYKDEKVFDISL